ncbi:hypothetical protein GF357_00885 [Candidatus Dojkabacteria bacterium]|nr:hypothetical protein [Candidatus Dojkabacteria bacterium]
MKDKTTKTLVTLILVVAVILGLGGIGVAYYYSTIGEVAPTTTFADQPYCSVFYKEDSEECSVSDIPAAQYYQFFDNNCNNVSEDLIGAPPLYECRYNGASENSQCSECTDSEFSELLTAKNVCQCCKSVEYEELNMCRIGTSVRSCANVMVQDLSSNDYGYGVSGNLISSELDPDLPVRISVAFDADLDYQELGIKINDEEKLKITLDDLISCVDEGNSMCDGSGKDTYVLNLNPDGQMSLGDLIGDAGSLVVTGFATYTDSEGEVVDLDMQACKRIYSIMAPEVSTFGQIKMDSDVLDGNLSISGVEIPVGNFVPGEAESLTFELETEAQGQEISPVTVSIATTRVAGKDMITISSTELQYPGVSVPDDWSQQSYAVKVSATMAYGDQTYNLGSQNFDLKQIPEGALSCVFTEITPDKSDETSVQINELELSVNGITEDTEMSFKIDVADQSEQQTEAFQLKAGTKIVKLDLSDDSVNSSPLIVALDSGATQGAVSVDLTMTIDGSDYSCGALPVLLGGATSAISLDNAGEDNQTSGDTSSETDDAQPQDQQQGEATTTDTQSPTNQTQAGDYNIVVETTGTGCFGRSASQSSGKFTISITNNGSSTEKITSIVDKLPLGFQYNHGISMTLNSGVVGDGSQNPSVDNVGNTQELRWEKSGGWDISPGGKIVVGFNVIAGSQALTGTNRNEVFVTPADDPSDDSLRDDYAFEVKQSCTSPDTGLFDDVASRIGLALITIIFGIVFYIVALEKNLKVDLTGNPWGEGIIRASEGIRKAGLRFNSPGQYFREYFESKISKRARKLAQKPKRKRKKPKSD